MRSSFGFINAVILSVTAFILFSQTALAEPLELSLDTCIALTYEDNPALQIAEAHTEQAAWTIKEAQSNKNVSIDYTHTDMRSTSPPTWSTSSEAFSPYNYFSNQVVASIPLYTGGKVENMIKQAELAQCQGSCQ
ncbi:TolC family protein [Pectinatus cerevisiiphilus]|uniref:Outer membrane efflux protein n=1 Tax=Pectinatus cerevisiiphilus TaxID=86956 RepID=A0A4R3K082_9FIRM|nr:TolC family protein [Pectinatus cerevisiiphilus]TCS75250.1 outer membrane efflux protein [Pectinatus cerevisiiphilus]